MLRPEKCILYFLLSSEKNVKVWKSFSYKEQKVVNLRDFARAKKYHFATISLINKGVTAI